MAPGRRGGCPQEACGARGSAAAVLSGPSRPKLEGKSAGGNAPALLGLAGLGQEAQAARAPRVSGCASLPVGTFAMDPVVAFWVAPGDTMSQTPRPMRQAPERPQGCGISGVGGVVQVRGAPARRGRERPCQKAPRPRGTHLRADEVHQGPATGAARCLEPAPRAGSVAGLRAGTRPSSDAAPHLPHLRNLAVLQPLRCWQR